MGLHVGPRAPNPNMSHGIDMVIVIIIIVVTEAGRILGRVS